MIAALIVQIIMTEPQQNNQIRILTDHGLVERFYPLRKPITLSSSFWTFVASRLPGGKALVEFIWGFKCWLVSLPQDKHIPIVTVGHGHGFVFAMLQYLFRPLIRPRLQVMFAFLLNQKGRGLTGLYDSFKMRVFRKVVAMAVVNGQADVNIFAAEFNIPKRQLIFHPHHITLEQYQFDIKDDGFIFAGGNGARDYRTLIEAVKSIDRPVFIATTLTDVPAMAAPYDHITVRGVSHEEFRSLMAACTIFIEAHDPDFFRTAGHQTFLNAMWMGKPVVMADLKSAEGYFDEGIDGLIVPAGDIAAFRREIQSLLDDSDKAARIGAKAKEKLRHPSYRILNCMQSIYNIALNLSCKKYGLDPDQKKIDMY